MTTSCVSCSLKTDSCVISPPAKTLLHRDDIKSVTAKSLLYYSLERSLIRYLHKINMAAKNLCRHCNVIDNLPHRLIQCGEKANDVGLDKGKTCDNTGRFLRYMSQTTVYKKLCYWDNDLKIYVHISGTMQNRTCSKSMLKLVSIHIQAHLNAFLQILEYFSQICLGSLARESPCITDLYEKHTGWWATTPYP